MIFSARVGEKRKWTQPIIAWKAMWHRYKIFQNKLTSLAIFYNHNLWHICVTNIDGTVYYRWMAIDIVYVDLSPYTPFIAMHFIKIRYHTNLTILISLSFKLFHSRTNCHIMRFVWSHTWCTFLFFQQLESCQNPSYAISLFIHTFFNLNNQYKIWWIEIEPYLTIIYYHDLERKWGHVCALVC